jgi:hypothetical protein
MFEPRILKKFITWFVLLGFITFCIGYLYAVISLLRGYRAPLEFWLLIIPLVFLFLAAFGLKLFRVVFVARE